jgi:hypothetical protein
MLCPRERESLNDTALRTANLVMLPCLKNDILIPQELRMWQVKLVICL